MGRVCGGGEKRARGRGKKMGLGREWFPPRPAGATTTMHGSRRNVFPRKRARQDERARVGRVREGERVAVGSGQWAGTIYHTLDRNPNANGNGARFTMDQ